jgi:glycosyltransferase involved in cell wall biosynthesis
MNILICSEYFLPHIGGVEQHSLALAKLIISNSKNKCVIATSFVPGSNKIEKKGNLKIRRFNISGSLVKGYNGEIDEYKEFLLNSDFDLIFFNACQQWTFDLSLTILQKIKSKKILFPCGFSRIDNIFYKPYFNILKKEINNFDRIICVSKKWRDYKFCQKYFKKKIDIVSNTHFNYPQKNFENRNILSKKMLNENNFNFLNISNFKFLKGQDRTINIFNNINKKNINLFLLFSKKSSSFFFYIYIFIYCFFSNLINIQKNKKIYLINRDKYNFPIENVFYKNSNFFIFGSRLEYSPLVFFESMNNGLYFFTYDVGILKDFKKLKKLKKIIIKKNTKQLIKEINSIDYNKVNKEVFSNYKGVINQYRKIFNL